MINNPSEDPNSQNTLVAKAIWAALQTQTSNNAKNFITKMAKEEIAKAIEAGADILEFAVGVSMFVGLYKGRVLCFSSTEFFSVVCSYAKEAVTVESNTVAFAVVAGFFFSER